MIQGQLTDPRFNFASVHGPKLVTVRMSFSLPRGNFRCCTSGNPPCRGNFSPFEQNEKLRRGRAVLCMLIINVLNKFPNKKFQKAPETDKRGHSL